MNTPTINAPSTEPGIDPRPPNNDVPPITTAVMVAKLISSNEIGEIEPTRPIATQAPKPQISPATA